MKQTVITSDNPDFLSDDDQLQEEWKWISLEDAVEKVIDYRGRTPPITNQGIPHITTSNIRNGNINWQTEKFVTPETYEKYMTRGIPEPGDIFFTMEGPLGEVAVLRQNRKFSIAQRILLLRVKKEILNCDFLAFALMSPNIRTAIEMKATGSGVKGVAYKRLKDLQIPLPPLDEQQRIVVRVEALLSHVDAAGDRLSRVPAIMKRFRQSVLASACSGRLTEEWREENPDVEPASLLVEKIIKSHNSDVKAFGGKAGTPTEGVHDISEVDIPDSWTICELKYLSKPGKPITYGILKPGQDIPNGIPYIRVTDYKNNKLKIESIRHTTPEIAANYKRSILSTDDLLLSIRGTVGRVCQIPQELHGGNITQDSVRISVHDSISREYIELYLQTPSVQKRFENAIKGVAIRGVNVGDVRVLQVILPPIAEQREIVRRVGLLFERADAIEREVVAAGRRCERLTQAVMVKAFSGML